VLVIGLLLMRLPTWFRRARLPALVALMPPAEKTLWPVMDVAVEELVALLCTPLDELVALDLVVHVRARS
jgi:hypothetical protein